MSKPMYHGTVNGHSWDKSLSEYVYWIFEEYLNEHDGVSLKEFKEAFPESFKKREKREVTLLKEKKEPKDRYSTYQVTIEDVPYYITGEWGASGGQELLTLLEQEVQNLHPEIVITRYQNTDKEEKRNLAEVGGTKEVEIRKAKSRVESEVSVEMAPFTAALRRIKVPQFDEVDIIDEDRCNVRYEEGIPENEKIPGLIAYIYREEKRVITLLSDILCENYRLSLDNLRIILSPIKKTKRYFNGKEEKSWEESIDPGDLRKLIDQYKKSGINAVPSEDLFKIIKGHPIVQKDFIEDVIAGEYCGMFDSIQIIKIYYRVLNTKSSEDYLAAVQQTLAHELFHAQHHLSAPATFYTDMDEADRVREASADFFSFIYCLNFPKGHRKDDIYDASVRAAFNRYNLWIKRFDTVWPYAYALYYMKNSSNEKMEFSKEFKEYSEFGCIEKLKEVFEESKSDMRGAYEKLTSYKTYTTVYKKKQKKELILDE